MKKSAKSTRLPSPEEFARARGEGTTIGGLLSGRDGVPGGTVFVGLIVIAGIALAIWGGWHPSAPIPAKTLTREEQLIRDAVTLQRMIERGEKERQEKFDKEYQRQERQGR